MQMIDPRTAGIEAEFELDLQVVTEVAPDMDAGCSTNDGCAPTCASSCASNA